MLLNKETKPNMISLSLKYWAYDVFTQSLHYEQDVS